MGVTRADLVRSGRYLDISDEAWMQELEHRQVVINRMAGNDAWATKIYKPIGIVLTAHCGGLPFLKSSVESWKKLGYWITLAYDNFLDPEWPEPHFEQFMPPKDVLDQIDTLMVPHHQTWGGPSYPYIWLLKLVAGIMTHFEYVVVVNGDCIIEKPEGFERLLGLMGDADFMSAGPVFPREIGTAGFIIRGRFLLPFADHLLRHVVPFEAYEQSTQEFGNTEGRVAVAVRDLGLKQVICRPGSCPKEAICEQFHVPGGQWHDIVGLRHIHGELNYAYRYKSVPPPSKYLDPRYCGAQDMKAALAHESGDLEFVKNWWMKD